MTTKKFNYNIFSGTTKYHYNNQISPLLYWTDGVNKLLENKQIICLLKIVNDFIFLLNHHELVLNPDEAEMMHHFQVWHLVCKEKNINFWCQADSGMPHRSKSLLKCSPELVDFTSLKLYCTLYQKQPTKYILMLNSEY